jgi:hypothetical protein
MRFPDTSSRVLVAGAIATAFMITSDVAVARYLEPSQVDLVRILAPPPAPQSPEGKADLEAVLAAQRTRTDAEVKRAQADDELSVFRYADVMGAGFAPENLPFATAFFKDVAAEAAYSHYGDWSKDRIEYRTHAKNSWVREIKKIFGPLVDTEHRELWNVTRYLRLAALEKCRGAFQTYARIPGRIAGGDALAQSRTLGGEPHQRVAFYEVAPAAACNR